MLVFSILLIAAPAALQPARETPVINPQAENSHCPETAMSLARRVGEQRPEVKRLAEMPPAITFMAVDRRIAGCPVPLTATEYRSKRR